jgi:hypothetical protein
MPIKFDIVSGETEHISLNGQKRRNPTVLMRLHTPVSTLSLSRKALLLGAALIVCQALDAILTYAGLRMLGIEMEGNAFLRDLMHAYGIIPALCIAKSIALVGVVILMLAAHRRKWIRPVIAILSVIYIVLAVVPWTLAIWFRSPSV